MASRPTRTTRSRQPSVQPPEPSKPTTRLTSTTTGSRTKPASSNADTTTMKPPSKTTVRKPSSRTTSVTPTEEKHRTASQSSTSTIVEEPSHMAVDGDRESIKAYLRIRPNVKEESIAPYLTRLSATTVRMTDPGTTDPSRTRLRQSLASSTAEYTFSHVFQPETNQPSFFSHTTLPLVRDLLIEGSNALLFAYGVSNSGKTYTVQGGKKKGEAGILPRAFDVLFNSIGDLQGDGHYRPVRLQGVEPNTAGPEPDLSLDDLRAAEPALATVLDGVTTDLDVQPEDIEHTSFRLDRNHEYTVWMSYAEVYCDQVYDLLLGASSSSTSENGGANTKLPRRTGIESNEVRRKGLSIKTSPPGDAWDSDQPAGKYPAGLRHVRATSAAQAKRVLKLGQLHRRVFGTLVNSESSRSHGMVTIKVLKVHKGERNDPSAIQTSRLTLVDLAGSERTKYTQTTGDRLKEAGSINRSLMVLGQCLETLRANQRKVGMSLAGGGRSDTRETRKGLQVVPFRHDKLTELLMDYFVGDGGRVAMIVNVNPFDTGFDENAHVMRFAAIAKEVTFSAAALVHNPTVQPPPSPSKLPLMNRKNSTTTPSDLAAARAARKQSTSRRRSVVVSLGGGPPKTLEILEEEEDDTTEVEDSYSQTLDDNGQDGQHPMDAFIRELFGEIDELRAQLYDAKMKCATIDAEVRAEVVGQMQETISGMEQNFRRRLQEEVKQQELKMDRKIEMLKMTGTLFRNGSFQQPLAPHQQGEEDEEDEDVQMEEAQDEDEDGYNTEEAGEEDDVEKSLRAEDFPATSPEPPTPVASKTSRPFELGDDDIPLDLPDIEFDEPAPPITKLKSKSKSRPQPVMVLDSDEEDDAGTSPDDGTEIPDSPDEDEYKPPPPKAKPKVSTSAKGKGKGTATPVEETSSRSNKRRLSKITMDDMSDLDELPDADPDASIAVIPNRKARAEALKDAPDGVVYIPRPGEVDGVKKKKRVLGKKPVVTQDQIEKLLDKEEVGRPVRRITRRS